MIVIDTSALVECLCGSRPLQSQLDDVTAARSREIDLAIAATAISRDIPLWTLNRRDFEDIPGLRLA